VNYGISNCFSQARYHSRPDPNGPLFKDVLNDSKEVRDRLINDAFRIYGYTQSEIGDYIRLHTTTISRIVKKLDA